MLWRPADVLAAWENAAGVGPAERAALLLAFDDPAREPGDVWDLPVSHAAERLQRSLRDGFGAQIDAVVTCPHCGEVLEAHLTLPAPAPPGPTSADVDGWRVRIPTLREIVVAAKRPDAAETLAEACTVALEPGAPRPAEHVLDAAAERLSGAASLHGTVTCAACGSLFDADLDPGALLWDHICAEAPALLKEIATLASAFGWTEDDILRLPSSRRSHYLGIVTGSA